MPGREYVKQFAVDQLEYEFLVTRDSQLVVRLTGGRFKDGERVLFYEDSFYHNATKYHVSNKVGNPVKVMRTFLALTIEYLEEHRPPYLWFYSFEANRARVYKKLLRKLPAKYYSITHGEEERQVVILRKPME